MRAAFFLALVALAAQGADAATFLQCANGSATGLLALVGTVLNMILSTLFASTPASCAVSLAETLWRTVQLADFVL